MKRTTLAATAVSAGLLAATLAPAAGTAAATPTADAPASSAASPCGTGGVLTVSPPTCTYASPGTDTFTVPDGVTAVTVDLYGAEGGSAAGYVAPNPPNTGAPGGLGGRTRATLAVTPGDRLQLTVGAAGVPGSSRHGEFARPGGTGHGSGGGGAHGGGGSGGGASDVRVGAFGAADRVLVAGGGGGAGNGGPLLHGGAGGGPAGEDGGQGGGPAGSGTAGGGGGPTGPGTGSPHSALGAPGAAGSDLDAYTSLPNPGSGGSGGNGAQGGNGGGGGGGGYFGGGGGAGGGNPGNLYGAGGGGGNDYAAPSAREALLDRGVNHGDGRAVVTFRYGSALALTTDGATPLFGHPVTVTAAVAPPTAGAGTPTGSVTFTDGRVVLATVPLTDGQARFTTAALQPGPHTVTAHYDGDPSFAPSDSDGPARLTVGFSAPCLTGDHAGPLAVAAGQALCVTAGGRQTGPVTVAPGGALAVSDAVVTGPLVADGALALTVCGSALTGRVAVTGSSGPVRFGAADPADGCAGNTLTGPLVLNGNTGGVEASADSVTGPLRCADNRPAPTTTGTTVDGPRTGQCR